MRRQKYEFISNLQRKWVEKFCVAKVLLRYSMLFYGELRYALGVYNEICMALEGLVEV